MPAALGPGSGPVAGFCAELRQLCRDSGCDLKVLAGELRISRSQLGAILNGQIRRPPDWSRLVGPMVAACTRGDAHAVARWRQRHAVLVGVWEELSRRERQGQAGPAQIHFRAGGPGDRAVLVPRQLPGDVRGFVSRAGDIERLDGLLGPGPDGVPSAPVVVVVGTAGVGKTALAVHWAHRVQARFPGGQLFVNLRGYDPGDPLSPAVVLERFVTALGVAPGAVPGGLEERAALYRSLLAERRVLVVLDNAATAGQVRPLLPGSGGCLALVTSRSLLSGLVARDGAYRVALQVLSEPEAVALLRATTAGYRAVDRDEQMTELARLCARLPLALRIAAERAAARPHMPLSALIQDLRDESSLWDALSSAGDEEADAVRSVFAWSYRALPAAAARMFRLLGLHPGPEFGVQAAAAAAAVPAGQARSLLDVLAGAHLVEPCGPDRYQFHDLLRAYAAGQAAEHEGKAARRQALARVCAWYLHAAYAATGILDPRRDSQRDPGLVLDADPAVVPPDFTGPARAQEWMFTEADTMIAAARAAAAEGLDEAAWKLPVVLRNWYSDRHPPAAWLPLGELALGAAERAGDRLGQALVLAGLGITYRLASRLPEAMACHQRAVGLEQADPAVRLMTVHTLGMALLRARRLEQAQTAFTRVLTGARAAGDEWWSIAALGNLALTHFDAGRLEQAEETIQAAFARMPQEYSPIIRANWLWCLARIHRERGRISEAADAITTALRTARDQENTMAEAAITTELGLTRLTGGDPASALDILRQAAALHRRLGDRSREALTLDAAGQACRALGQHDQAAGFHRGAAVICKDLDDGWNEALALSHLASTLDDLGENAQARDTRTRALELTAAYTDPRATGLRDHLTACLRTPAS